MTESKGQINTQTALLFLIILVILLAVFGYLNWGGIL